FLADIGLSRDRAGRVFRIVLVELGELRFKKIGARKTVVDPAEIGTQHDVANHSPQTMRDHNNSVVGAPLVQGVEHFDRRPANFSPDPHIAWRSTKISRRIAEIGLKEQGIKREVQEYD